MPIKGLEPLPKDVDLKCYRCDVAPATHFKWMKTPSGGEYRRGWCPTCQDPSKARQTARRAVEKSPAPKGYPSPGEEVNVAFSGRILHYVPGSDHGEVIILVGSKAYSVPTTACAGGEVL